LADQPKYFGKDIERFDSAIHSKSRPRYQRSHTISWH